MSEQNEYEVIPEGEDRESPYADAEEGDEERDHGDIPELGGEG